VFCFCKLIAYLAARYCHGIMRYLCYVGCVYTVSSSQENVLGILESLLVCLKQCREKVEQSKGTKGIAET